MGPEWTAERREWAHGRLEVFGEKQTTADGAIDGLVRDAFGSPPRLRDAVELLGDDESEARALLVRAVRYAEDPRRPEPPGRDPLPDAGTYQRD